jgi:hypothetical protein
LACIILPCSKWLSVTAFSSFSVNSDEKDFSVSLNDLVELPGEYVYGTCPPLFNLLLRLDARSALGIRYVAILPLRPFLALLRTCEAGRQGIRHPLGTYRTYSFLGCIGCDSCDRSRWSLTIFPAGWILDIHVGLKPKAQVWCHNF